MTGEASRNLSAFLGKDHRFGPADDEGISPFEEISDHFRKGLGPFNHQGVASVVDEHQMRIRSGFLPHLRSNPPPLRDG